MSVSKFRLTSRTVVPALQKAARDSSLVVFIPPIEKRSMAGMMSYHQALKCLQEGKAADKPTQNKNGDWELTMQRFVASYLFELKVIVKCEDTSVVAIYVFPDSGD